jgi:hypothetical protein
MSSRNNNLSNRSQKMSLTVLPTNNQVEKSEEDDSTDIGLVAGVVISLTFVCGGVGAAVYYRTRNEDGKKIIRDRLSNFWKTMTCNKRGSEPVKRPVGRFSIRSPQDAFQSAYAQFKKPQPAAKV